LIWQHLHKSRQGTLPRVLSESCNILDILMENETHERDIITTIVFSNMHVRLTSMLLQPTLIGEGIGTTLPAQWNACSKGVSD
jgi:hypothetical protein